MAMKFIKMSDSDLVALVSVLVRYIQVTQGWSEVIVDEQTLADAGKLDAEYDPYRQRRLLSDESNGALSLGVYGIYGSAEQVQQLMKKELMEQGRKLVNRPREAKNQQPPPEPPKPERPKAPKTPFARKIEYGD